MNYVSGFMGKQASVRVIVSQDIREAILREVVDTDTTISEVVRVALEAYFSIGRSSETPDVVSAPVIVPSYMRPKETVLDLVERGYTVTQIAAMKRRPYRDIMAEIGDRVDTITERRGTYL
jgi:hypothetical protein